MTAERVTFETKIAVVVCDDLPTWQKLNMTAFLVSGVAAAQPELAGEPYQDAADRLYLPMFRQPVLVFSGSRSQIRTAYERAMAREIPCTIFTQELFATGNDRDNRAAVRAVASADLDLVGLAMHADRRIVDKALKGLALHQ